MQMLNWMPSWLKLPFPYIKILCSVEWKWTQMSTSGSTDTKIGSCACILHKIQTPVFCCWHCHRQTSCQPWSQQFRCRSLYLQERAVATVFLLWSMQFITEKQESEDCSPKFSQSISFSCSTAELSVSTFALLTGDSDFYNDPDLLHLLGTVAYLLMCKYYVYNSHWVKLVTNHSTFRRFISP